MLRTFVIFLLVAFFAATGSADAAKRALVIGNNAYEGGAIAALDRAVGDARAYARTLEEERGFEVTLVTDAGRAEMLTALGSFVSSIQPGDVAMFVFSGHAMQLDPNRRDQLYLFPTDLSAGNYQSGMGMEAFLDAYAISFGRVSDWLTRSGARLRVFVLDACRNAPQVGDDNRTRNAGLAVGLGKVNSSEGEFIFYSAGPGEEALDSLDGEDPKADGTSVFTRVFLERFKAGVYLEDIANEVQARVKDLAATSNHVQRPYYSDGVTGWTCLDDDCGRTTATSAEDPIEASFWKICEGAKDPQYCQAYLDRFPDGPRAALAELRIKDIADSSEAERLAVAQAAEAAAEAEAARLREAEARKIAEAEAARLRREAAEVAAELNNRLAQEAVRARRARDAQARREAEEAQRRREGDAPADKQAMLDTAKGDPDKNLPTAREPARAATPGEAEAFFRAIGWAKEGAIPRSSLRHAQTILGVSSTGELDTATRSALWPVIAGAQGERSARSTSARWSEGFRKVAEVRLGKARPVSMSLNRDGTRLAIVTFEPDGGGIGNHWLMVFETTTGRRLAESQVYAGRGDEEFASPVFLDDDRKILAFMPGRNVSMIVETRTGQLVDGPHASSADGWLLSPDGSSILVWRGGVVDLFSFNEMGAPPPGISIRNGKVAAAAFQPGTDRIFIATQGKRSRLFATDPEIKKILLNIEFDEKVSIADFRFAHDGTQLMLETVNEKGNGAISFYPIVEKEDSTLDLGNGRHWSSCFKACNRINARGGGRFVDGGGEIFDTMRYAAEIVEADEYGEGIATQTSRGGYWIWFAQNHFGTRYAVISSLKQDGSVPLTDRSGTVHVFRADDGKRMALTKIRGGPLILNEKPDETLTPRYTPDGTGLAVFQRTTSDGAIALHLLDGYSGDPISKVDLPGSTGVVPVFSADMATIAAYDAERGTLSVLSVP